jgi:hypothetical protein
MQFFAMSQPLDCRDLLAIMNYSEAEAGIDASSVY